MLFKEKERKGKDDKGDDSNSQTTLDNQELNAIAQRFIAQKT